MPYNRSVDEISRQKLLASRRRFGITAGIILAGTGFAKCYSSFGHAHVLDATDPIFPLTFRHMMMVVGLIELGIALICFLDKKSFTAVTLIAWLAGTFCLYRLGLSVVGWRRPCPCLGTLTQALGISQALADMTMRLIAFSLLIASCTFVIVELRQRKALRISIANGVPLPAVTGYPPASS